MIARIPKLALAGIALVVGAALAVGALAAFGNGSTTTPAVPSAFGVAGPFAGASGRPVPDTLHRFQQCMSDHGVELPRPGQPPPPGARFKKGVHRPSPKARAAFRDCGRYLPQRPPGTPGGRGGPLPGVPPPGLPPRPFRP